VASISSLKLQNSITINTPGTTLDKTSASQQGGFGVAYFECNGNELDPAAEPCTAAYRFFRLINYGDEKLCVSGIELYGQLL